MNEENGIQNEAIVVEWVFTCCKKNRVVVTYFDSLNLMYFPEQ